jgi:hypothetical protein
MFAQSMLISEIAQRRQTQLVQRAELWHRLFRPTVAGAMSRRAPRCSVIEFPTASAHTSPVEAYVA